MSHKCKDKPKGQAGYYRASTIYHHFDTPNSFKRLVQAAKRYLRSNGEYQK